MPLANAVRSLCGGWLERSEARGARPDEGRPGRPGVGPGEVRGCGGQDVLEVGLREPDVARPAPPKARTLVAHRHRGGALGKAARATRAVTSGTGAVVV